MKKDPLESGKVSNLREKAEKALGHQPADTIPITPEEAKLQLHELRVHQIELEMQNDELRETQLNLEASRAGYFDLYEMAPVGYFTMNEKGLVVGVNLTAADLLGVDRSVLLKQPLSHFIVREDQDGFYLHIKELFKSGSPQAFDLRMEKDAGFFWVNLRAVIAHDGKNPPVSRITISDITARKWAEDSVRQNDARLESLLKLSQHRSLSSDELLDFALSEALDLTKSKIGYIYRYNEGRKEFTLITWSKSVMKECTVQEPQTIYQLEKTGIWGEAVRRARPLIINDFDAPNPLKKGYPEGHSPLHKFLTVPVFLEGHIVGVAGVANKATDYSMADANQLTLLMDAAWRIAGRKEAEEALTVSEARYRSLFENMLDGYAHCRMVFDENKRPVDFIYLGVNNAFETLTGLKNVTGKRVTEVIPGIRESQPDLLETYGRVASTGAPERFEVDFIPLSLWLSISVYSPAKGEFVAVFEDITFRKNAEMTLKDLNGTLERRAVELALVNRDLEAFSYSVSHDLRNPLGAILTNIEVLSMEAGSLSEKDAKEALAYIVAAANRMTTVISDLLTLSGISRKPIKVEKVNLSEMASAFLAELKKSDPAREAEFRIQPGLIASGDSGLLRILLDNLLRNAWKFTSKRAVSQIEAGETDKEGRRCFFIRDNGVGFDMKDADRLFKPFQRLHSQQEFRGTGIGLAISGRILEKHGGKIWAEGEVDKGAVVYFCLAKE